MPVLPRPLGMVGDSLYEQTFAHVCTKLLPLERQWPPVNEQTLAYVCTGALPLNLLTVICSHRKRLDLRKYEETKASEHIHALENWHKILSWSSVSIVKRISRLSRWFYV